MKQCIKCGESKPLSAFYWRKDRESYFGSCISCIKIKSDEWYTSNKESKLKSCRLWEKNNKDKVIAFRKLQNQRDYRKVANCSYSAIRRSKKRQTYVDLSQEEKALIKELYLKARKLGMHVDHIKPLAKGGEHCLSNLQLLSPEENMKKGAKYEGPT